MKLDSLLVTGDAFFLRRHAGLLEALRGEGLAVETLALDDRGPAARLAYARQRARFAIGYARAPERSVRARFDPRAMRHAFHKDPATFAFKSRELSARIAERRPRPDAVLHVFGLSSPGAAESSFPYAHYLDYTRALARRNDAAELPNALAEDAAAWIELERRAYAGAVRLFATSELVRRSLQDDYGIGADKIAVVGAGANFEAAPHGPYGTQRLLFNASDFGRKGGELVLAAWPLIARAHPRATLVTVGRRLPRRVSGVEDRGRVAHAEMAELLVRSDLVLAPAFSDPFPGFAIEAMSAGVPAIVSNRDAMPEIVTNGSDGVVLDDLTPQRLAAETIALLSDAARVERLASAARATASARLNWQHVAATMAAELRGA